MIAVLILIFVAVGLAAAFFVAAPVLRIKAAAGAEAGNGRSLWLGLSAGLGVMAVGLTVYGLLGQPAIALSSLSKPKADDYPGLVAAMARMMPNRPGDLQGWTLLGNGYLNLGNPGEAAKAFAHAIDVAKSETGNAPALLYASYGEALSQAGGEVTPEAEAAFRSALAEDPRDMMARYYLGFALVAHGDKDGALQLWEAVLSEAPPDAPWRNTLLDQVARLKATTGGAAPNPEAMVAQLAARLEGSPNDIDGWVRLIRAYKVLGQNDKAEGALTKARSIFAGKADSIAALAQSAKDNGLN